MTVACNGWSEGHADSIFGPQDHHGACLNILSGREFEIVFLEQYVENHEDLQHCEVAADAAARSATEWNMRERSLCGLVGFGETLRVEPLGVWPVLRGMMRAVDVDDDHGALRNGESTDIIFGDSHAVDHPEGRVESKGLVDYLRRVLEAAYVLETHRSSVEDGIKFLTEFCEAIWTRSQKIEKP